MQNNRRKFVALGLCCVLILVSFVSCATVEQTVQERPKTVIGAAAGVAGGALLGGLIFKSAGGAIVGGLLGGLAGGLIGNAMEAQPKDRAATAKEYGYSPTQGTFIRIEKVQVEPTTIKPGEQVTLVTQYALLTPQPEQPITVTERWEIRQGNTLTGNPVLKLQRQDGTWASAIPVTLPSTATAGIYRVAVAVEAGGKRSTAETTFTVQ